LRALSRAAKAATITALIVASTSSRAAVISTIVRTWA
jgi:hypothetical protein